ncbi:3-methyl-adenine D glycosylase I [Piromyces finnis]|uniref:3-methyl-adenine D glycosylase I n=1 Tax=Piromyces finnis TaxID=1754191 RepID=A0A1Y1UZC6_9FUNG|nr:3-methyl-adenine D glycosylase I [Piromyces finnis]|eukprot:ORX43831.1 3-methyl-adenine D glycosylase I [Piromyces finnis]
MPPKKHNNKIIKKEKDIEKDVEKETIDIDGKTRCEFASIIYKKKKSEIMLRYHDKRWCKPIHEENELYAMLVLETMQAGLSWLTILEKEENYRKAFDKLNPVIVAKYNAKKIEKLMQNPGIIRNKRKIVSIINNAKAFLKVQNEFGTFDKYIWSFTDRKTIDHHRSKKDEMPAKSELSEKISKDLKKRGFQFVGPISIYSYLQGIGIINDHNEFCDFR